jgi:hypothetical protein
MDSKGFYVRKLEGGGILGKQMAKCLVCHRTLKDADSIARGIGPTCLKRINQVRKMYKRKPKIKEVKGQINLFEMEGKHE